MAGRSMTVEFMAQAPRVEAQAPHAALVAGFRTRLAGKKSPLDHVPAEQLERARAEFRELPEVAGEPLPATSRAR